MSASIFQNFIQKDDLFFSKLIDLIPKHLYQLQNNDDENEGNTKYYKHRKLPLGLDEKKKISKQRREEKYSATATSTEEEEEEEEDLMARENNEQDQTKKTANKKKNEVATNEKLVDTEDSQPYDENSNSLELLRLKLQQRIHNLKESRTSKKDPTTTNIGDSNKNKNKEQIKNKNEQKKLHKKEKSTLGNKNDFMNATKKIKQELENKISDVNTNTSGNQKNKSKKNDTDNDIGTLTPHHSKATTTSTTSSSISMDVTDIQFSGLRALDEDPHKTKDNDVGKPGSKARRLKRMLEEAEKKQKRLQEIKQQGGLEGQKRIESELFSVAMKEAAGNTGVLQPSKLKKAIKRMEKSKQKSASEWQERLTTIEQTKNARLDKREENILKRKHGGVLPTTTTTTNDSQADSSNTAKSPITAKRPRLYHVLKEQQGEGGSSGGGGDGDRDNSSNKSHSKGTPISIGKGKTSHSNNNNNHNNKNSNTGNRSGGGGQQGRAGFEGKKQGFLNSKKG